MVSVDQRLRALLRTMRDTFGLRRLRPGQETIIRSVLQRRDTLAIMPTGAGKSLCYQLPAMHLPGITLVVSPLISLMKDQSDKLAEAGVATTVVNSSLTRKEERGALEKIARRESAIVFVTPERLSQRAFLDLLQPDGKPVVSLVVIDEAHCISQWGHDFRPAFLDIADAILLLGQPPSLALTATATPEVVSDIVRALHLREPQIVITDLYRENLVYEVCQVTNAAEKLAALHAAIEAHPGSAIVYAATVKEVDEVAARLASAGHSVRKYHGRMSIAARKEAQDEFMSGACRLMVATNAFGMGIDKPDIRLVVHDQVPGSLEAYYQESGRAGRDGEASHCVLLFDQRDRKVQQFFQAGRYPTLELAEQIYRQLLNAGDQPLDFDQLHDALDQVGANKLQVALKMLVDEKIATRNRRGQYRLRSKAPSADALAASVERYRQFALHDAKALESMISYAQSARCRWRLILEYFQDENEVGECGVCDNCKAPPQVAIEAPPEPVLTESPSPFPEGEWVSVKRYGKGQVVAAAASEIEIRFDDGQTRSFLPSAVKMVRRKRGKLSSTQNTSTAS
jgi:ATP-dependent DNA helicase RecQ